MHEKSVHDKIRDSFICDECGFTSTTRQGIQRHGDGIHRQIRNYLCNECDYAGARKENLTRHIKAEHLKLRDAKCDRCSYAGLSENDLKRHHERVHLQIKNHKCPLCKYKFYYRSRLMKHMRVVHDIEKNQTLCRSCDLDFHDYNLLIDHARDNHISAELEVEEKDKPFGCEYCSYRSNRKDRIKQHTNLHHEKTENKSYKTDIVSLLDSFDTPYNSNI
jgi:KRAB domain-containing zinc finger protein